MILTRLVLSIEMKIRMFEKKNFIRLSNYRKLIDNKFLNDKLFKIYKNLYANIKIRSVSHYRQKPIKQINHDQTQVVRSFIARHKYRLQT